MTLKGKIFLSFSIVILLLLSKTILQVKDETEQLEMVRISTELNSAQIQFLIRLEQQQNNISKLLQVITLDQKYRSFLSMMKDNFFSFTEEIAIDTKGDIVSMVDDNLTLRGHFPQDNKIGKWLTKNLETLAIDKVLDNGLPRLKVIPIGGTLFSVIHAPLKEFLRDEYAVGVITVFKRIDNAWVKWLVGSNDISYKFEIVFFVNDRVIATNTSEKVGSALLKEANGNSKTNTTFNIDGNRYLLKYYLFPSKETNYGFIIASNLDKALQPFRVLEKRILIGGVIVFFIGILFTLFFSNKVVRPLRLLLSGVNEVNNGNYDFQISFKSNDEVGQLAVAFNKMVQGLKEKDKIRNTFNKYVNPSIVSEILANPEKLKLGGSLEKQTILFSDIDKFTTFSEFMSPEKLVLLLNDYLGAMTDEIIKNQGILDKYLGDGIMAFWGKPFCETDHAFNACITALDMQKKLNKLQILWQKLDRPKITARIGIATGEMIVGNLGSKHARDYTCIGDTVNYGSRLEQLNKHYGTQIIIDYFTRTQVKDRIEVRELDTVVVKGRTKGSLIYEVIGKHGEISNKKRDLITTYENALGKYRKGYFSEAYEKFSELLNSFPDDIPSKVLKKRCSFYKSNPPENWIGIHEMNKK
jgi:class 3 adenylate cyclase